MMLCTRNNYIRLTYHNNYKVYMFILILLYIAAGTIGGGLVAGLLLSTIFMLLYAMRQYTLKHRKADPAQRWPMISK